MLWLITKYALTAGMVVIISETAKRSDRLGGLLAALTLVTVLVLIWMKLEGQNPQIIARHAWYTFWYVVPTLPMFIVFPWALQQLGFWPALLASCVLTQVIFLAWATLLTRFGIRLM